MASDLQQRLEEAVVDLGGCVTAEEVADILRANGIKGRKGSCASCPIALLVSKRLGGLPVRVELAEIRAYGGTDPESPVAKVWQPEAVGDFITEFDNSRTPSYLLDLVAS